LLAKEHNAAFKTKAKAKRANKFGKAIFALPHKENISQVQDSISNFKTISKSPKSFAKRTTGQSNGHNSPNEQKKKMARQEKAKKEGGNKK